MKLFNVLLAATEKGSTLHFTYTAHWIPSYNHAYQCTTQEYCNYYYKRKKIVAVGRHNDWPDSFVFFFFFLSLNRNKEKSFSSSNQNRNDADDYVGGYIAYKSKKKINKLRSLPAIIVVGLIKRKFKFSMIA